MGIAIGSSIPMCRVPQVRVGFLTANCIYLYITCSENPGSTPPRDAIYFSKPRRGAPATSVRSAGLCGNAGAQTIRQKSVIPTEALRLASSTVMRSGGTCWLHPLRRLGQFGSHASTISILHEHKRIEKLRCMHHNPAKRDRTGAGTVALKQLSPLQIRRCDEFASRIVT